LLVKEVTYFLISKVRKRRRLKTSSTHLSNARYHIMSLPEPDTKLACHILPCLLKEVTDFLISKARKRRRLKTFSTHLINARYYVICLPEADTKLASHILPCIEKLGITLDVVVSWPCIRGSCLSMFYCIH
jgi:hypothetical protein